MKIGIITLPLHTNYGGLLQNYALQLVLKRLGHDPITFNWGTEQLPTWKRILYPIAIWTLRIVFRKNMVPFGYQPNKKESRIISKNTDEFIINHINKVDVDNDSESFAKEALNQKVDAIVVGSDQVWRPMYSADSLYIKYLDFANNWLIKKIAYAVSFGTSQWEYTKEETSRCKKLVSQFDVVTVRENTGVELCNRYLGVSASHVMDPTLLLEKKDYEDLVLVNKTPKSSGNLFYYILDPSPEKSTFVKKVSDMLGLKAFTVMPEKQMENRTLFDIKFHINKCVFPSVESWLRAFMDAEYVVCDSFHGCVFSIIFNKPFSVIGNKHRGNARFQSLLRMFNLEDRMLSIESSIEVNLTKPIDWDTINHIKSEWKERSIRLLSEKLYL